MFNQINNSDLNIKTLKRDSLQKAREYQTNDCSPRQFEENHPHYFSRNSKSRPGVPDPATALETRNLGLEFPIPAVKSNQQDTNPG